MPSFVRVVIQVASSAIPDDLADIQVEVVNVKVGKLTAVVPESLLFCFNVASRDTALAGARLHFEEVPIGVRCRQCDAECTIDEPPFECRSCGGNDIDILSGRELIVTSIEVADPNLDPSSEE